MNEVKDKKKRVVVFGGTGFIGRHLVNRLIQLGHYDCIVVTRNYDKANNIFGRYVNIIVFDFKSHEIKSFIKKDDIVINCLFISKNSTNNYIEDNKYFVLALLNQLSRQKIFHIIHISTAAVVGKIPELIINEETICNPVSAYQKIKFDIENIFVEFSHSSKIPVTILRPTEIFGNYGKGLVKLVDEIKCKTRLFLMLKLSIMGNRRTHYIYIDKVIHTILFFLDRKPPSNPVIYIVADDGPWNTLKHVYSKIYSIIYPAKKLTVPCSIPIKYVKFILSIFNKAADSNSVYESNRLKEEGINFETTFEDDIAHYIETII